MLTLSIKWLSGEVQKVETLKKSTVLKVIQQLGLSPAETTLFAGEKVLEHYQKIYRDSELSILVQPSPVSIFVYSTRLYFSSEDTMDSYRARRGISFDCYEPPSMSYEPPLKRFDKDVVYDRVYFVRWSKEEDLKEVCSRLDIPFSKCKGYVSQNTANDFYNLASLEKEDGELIRWEDFREYLGDKCGLYTDREDVYFPTLTDETKRRGLFSCKDWFSYFVMKR